MNLLRNVRYYDQSVPPEGFRGDGWRGVVVRVLNFFRWKLERWVMWWVLRVVLRRADATSDEQKFAERKFDKDALEDFSAVTETADAYEVRRGVRKALEDFVSEHEDRNVLPIRPLPLMNLAGMYGGTKRVGRYARGLRYMPGDPEGDFDEIKE